MRVCTKALDSVQYGNNASTKQHDELYSGYV